MPLLFIGLFGCESAPDPIRLDVTQNIADMARTFIAILKIRQAFWTQTIHVGNPSYKFFKKGHDFRNPDSQPNNSHQHQKAHADRYLQR